MEKNLVDHNTIHRLQTNTRDGKPIQQSKPQIGQAAKGKTNQGKNRHPSPRYTILHQDGQPNKHKFLPRRSDFAVNKCLHTAASSWTFY